VVREAGSGACEAGVGLGAGAGGEATDVFEGHLFLGDGLACRRQLALRESPTGTHVASLVACRPTKTSDLLSGQFDYEIRKEPLQRLRHRVRDTAKG